MEKVAERGEDGAAVHAGSEVFADDYAYAGDVQGTLDYRDVERGKLVVCFAAPLQFGLQDEDGFGG